MEKRKVAETFPPSEFIKEEMEARGWDVATLVKITQLSRDGIEQILENKARITPISAYALGQAFDTDRSFWMNLQKSYDENK